MERFLDESGNEKSCNFAPRETGVTLADEDRALCYEEDGDEGQEARLIGAVVGNYQIIQQIGMGGVGVVYLGQHTLLGRRAAIKVLLPEFSARPEIVSRFFNEARAVTTINDPGIVQVFDFGHHSDGSAYIVMELLEGEPMDRRLERIGRFGPGECLRLVQLMCASLAAVHARGIVHRDLKPENIFLVRDPGVPGGERAKLLDFGIAKLSCPTQGSRVRVRKNRACGRDVRRQGRQRGARPRGPSFQRHGARPH